LVETRLALKPHDRDMIVMLHEFEYTTGSETKRISSSLVVKGEDSLRTAMSKTVGLPLGIATKFILNGTIRSKGLQIPVLKDIYEPVLQELRNFDIRFNERKL
jgi:saccharopine dehydrogenase (NADP+, L-glutamate forming)